MPLAALGAVGLGAHDILSGRRTFWAPYLRSTDRGGRERRGPKLLLVGAVAATVGLALGYSGIRLGLLQGQETDLLLFPALCAAIADRLEGLRPRMALILICASVLLAPLAGLLLDRPLPALPFIALSFLLDNLDS